MGIKGNSTLYAVGIKRDLLKFFGVVFYLQDKISNKHQLDILSNNLFCLRIEPSEWQEFSDQYRALKSLINDLQIGEVSVESVNAHFSEPVTLGASDLEASITEGFSRIFSAFEKYAHGCAELSEAGLSPGNLHISPTQIGRDRKYRKMSYEQYQKHIGNPEWLLEDVG